MSENIARYHHQFDTKGQPVNNFETLLSQYCEKSPWSSHGMQIQHCATWCMKSYSKRLNVGCCRPRSKWSRKVNVNDGTYLQRQFQLCWTLQLITSLVSPCSSPLAACTTTVQLQSCSLGVSSTEWSACAIPGSASSRWWSDWLSLSALVLITPSAGSGISSSYLRPTFVSSCCIHPLEKLASWYWVICLPDRLLPQTKDILVQPIIPRYFAGTIHILILLSWTQ